ncbi:MAG TPA: trypsin-like peptidase domain-containing protein, partial [Microbacteriaceae bacterium]|nr:trypsin-like peptidase domain-containing protein [Microbacteriaceae bacterium]
MTDMPDETGNRPEKNASGVPGGAGSPTGPTQPYARPEGGMTPPPAPAAPEAGRDAFGRPYPGYPQPYGVGGQGGYENGYGAPADSAPAGRVKPLRRRNAGLIVASLAVGALIGGAAGAAGGGLIGSYTASHGGQVSNVTTTGPANITVNDAKSATVVTAVAAKASPSVVTINVTGAQESGTGSGIVLTKDGYVLTNTHVVTLDGDAANVQISVTDNNGKIYPATIVGTDPVVDLAVIKLQGASDMAPATFANSEKVNVGQAAIAIGAPLGLSGTVTDGIVSSINRSISISSSAAPKSSSGDSQDQQGGGGSGSENPFNFWNFTFPGQGGTDSGEGGQQQQQQQTQASNQISLPVLQTDAAINPG